MPESKEALSSLEVICMEIIVALGAPTIAEFSKFARMSALNAAYRVNKLVTKGYVERVQSTVDKREYHLRPTEKYSRDYGDIFNYIDVDVSRQIIVGDIFLLRAEGNEIRATSRGYVINYGRSRSEERV